MTDYTDALHGIDQADLAKCGGGPGHTPFDRALLVIAEGGDVSLTIRTYYGGDGTPESEWHGRTLAYTLGANPDLEALRDGLAEGGGLASLIERVVAGHSSEWNGSTMVGTLTEDARDASEELVRRLEECEASDLQAWDAADWLYGSHTGPSLLRALGLSAGSTDVDVKAAASEMEAVAADRVVLTGKGIGDILAGLVEEARAQAANADAEEESV